MRMLESHETGQGAACSSGAAGWPPMVCTVISISDKYVPPSASSSSFLIMHFHRLNIQRTNATISREKPILRYLILTIFYFRACFFEIQLIALMDHLESLACRDESHRL